MSSGQPLFYFVSDSEDAVMRDYHCMNSFLQVFPIYLNPVYIFAVQYVLSGSTGGGVVKDLRTKIYETDSWYAQGFLPGGSEGLHDPRSVGRCFVQPREGPRGLRGYFLTAP